MSKSSLTADVYPADSSGSTEDVVFMLTPLSAPEVDFNDLMIELSMDFLESLSPVEKLLIYTVLVTRSTEDVEFMPTSLSAPEVDFNDLMIELSMDFLESLSPVEKLLKDTVSVTRFGNILSDSGVVNTGSVTLLPVWAVPVNELQFKFVTRAMCDL